MNSIRNRWRPRLGRQLTVRVVVASLVFGSAGVTLSTYAAAPSRADTGSALTDSPFNGSDGVLDTTPAGRITTISPTDVNGVELTLAGGGKEDTDCVGLGTGSPSPKDDLEAVYVGSAPSTDGNGHVFEYLAWTRASNNGTTTVDWELNQGSSSCNDGSGFVHRTVGDQLFTYDFQGSGADATISLRVWNGTAWGSATVLSTTSTPAVEGRVSSDGLFGEMVIDMNLAGFFGSPDVCKVLPTVIAKTRSSSASFTNQVKDTTLGISAPVSNCATIVVDKTDDLGLGVAGATFGLYVDNPPTKLATNVGNNTCVTAFHPATSPAASCSFGDVPAGTYYVAEISAPPGYSKDSTVSQVTAVADTTTTVAHTYVDPRNPGSVTVTKVDDTGEGVNGAQFGIFTDSEGSEPAPVTEGGNNTCTTAGGTATTPGSCLFAGVRPGSYFVLETSAPPGYTSDPTAQAVQVSSDTATAVAHSFVDPRLPSGISVTKAVNGDTTTTAAKPLVVENGAPLTYLITVTNTGQLPLLITSLNDTLHADLPSSCTQGLNSTLDVEASFTCTYTTTASSDAHNVASATGTDQFGRTPSAQAETFVHVLKPAIAVVKTGPAQAHVGDTLTYTLTVTNPGNTPLANVAVTDDKCPSAPALQSKTGGNQDSLLDPGETWTYTCTYVVQAGDGTSVVNHAGVAGSDQLGTMVTGSSQWTTTILHPAISIKKTANPTSVTNSGPVTYTYVVTNTGDVTLTGVAVTDNVIGPIGTIGTLAPGGSATLTKTVTVTTSTPPTNIGTASGTDPLGETVTATDQATISVVLAEVISPPAAPQTLPRTGAPLQREAAVALVLLILGGLLVAWSRRPHGAHYQGGR